MILLIITSIFWLIAFTKKLLFWIYLWQLKEYHVGRFADHFRTDKGKRLVFNYLLLVKVLGLLGIILFARLGLASSKLVFVYLIIAVLLVESLFFLKRVKQKTFKSPVLTRKISLILTTGLSFELLILSFVFGVGIKEVRGIAGLMLLDILAPLIVSGLVLGFQPLAVVLRDRILNQAKIKRAQFKDLLVIGVTGSYGKTSVKEFLATILSSKYKVLKTERHVNSEVGIATSILDDLDENYDVFVCEMGAYGPGGIKLLADIAGPKIGIITGINEQHLSTFGSLARTIKTKFELIDSLPEDGVAILNYSNQHIRQENVSGHNPKLKNVRYFALDEEADVWARDIKADKETISFKLFSKDGETADICLNLIGQHNVSNVLAAVTCAKNLGMSFEEIAEAAKKIEPWQSGMELKKGVNGLSVVDATYSANPSGVISHLDYLKNWPGKKIIVMPCLIELGKASEEVHKSIGQKINEVCDLAIITTKDRFREIKKVAPKAVFIENPGEIINKIKSFSQEGNVVLLESRISNQIINQLVCK
ncbi:MAG: UDP-N-acetylmuramoyl-tripeptide--D-alanyl-D-alanine ligase [Candidatus Nealsonbacteria bacterium]